MALQYSFRLTCLNGKASRSLSIIAARAMTLKVSNHESFSLSQPFKVLLRPAIETMFLYVVIVAVAKWQLRAGQSCHDSLKFCVQGRRAESNIHDAQVIVRYQHHTSCSQCCLRLRAVRLISLTLLNLPSSQMERRTDQKFQCRCAVARRWHHPIMAYAECAHALLRKATNEFVDNRHLVISLRKRGYADPRKPTMTVQPMLSCSVKHTQSA